MPEPILPNFQEYLKAKQLANPRQIPFLAYWAARFIAFANGHQCQDLETNIHHFLKSLSELENRKDWQIRQAHNSLQVYIFGSSDFLVGKK